MIDALVVGGGIAGLAAAWELARRGRRPVVLEASARAGGVIATDHVDGHVVDAGPDSLLAQKPAALALCRELGLGPRLVPTMTPRRAYVLRGGTLVPLPEASFLGIPTRLGPFVTTPLFSAAGKLRMAVEPFVPRRPAEAGDESIGAFMARRFGRELVDRLAEPLLAGIHAGDVDRLSVQALFPRLVEIERRHGSLLRGLAGAATRPDPDGAFRSLPGGIGELVDALVAALPGGTLRLESPVANVTGAGPYDATLASGENLTARAVILAVPAWAASGMLHDLDARIAAQCAEIPYTSTATVVLGFDRAQVPHPMEGSGFVVPRTDRQALMAATWITSKWPGRAPAGRVLMRGFLGGAGDPGVLAHPDDRLVAMVHAELSALMGIRGGPSMARVYRWPRASAQHEVGHLDRIAALDHALAGHPGLYLTGSGFRGTGIPDCVADARATAARADERLG